MNYFKFEYQPMSLYFDLESKSDGIIDSTIKI